MVHRNIPAGSILILRKAQSPTYECDMTYEPHGLSLWHRVAARIRMPLTAAGVVALFFVTKADLGPVWGWTSLGLFAVGMILYVRLGTPRGDPIDLDVPFDGRWEVAHSPTSKVPSHGIHAWSQTHAIDLTYHPEDGSKPEFAPLPVARRPEDFPGFGRPLRAPLEGEVVKTTSIMRDHWSRTSPLGLAYLVAESTRELLGPPGVLGNHVVIRADDGVCVLMAHLQQGSLEVSEGDRVETGQIVARCGNSGNSTEPHVHLQAMDRPSTWVAAGLPIRFEGRPPPPTGQMLESA